MIGRLFMFLKMVWARPSIQASFWLILESIFIWIGDKAASLCSKKKSKKQKLPKSKTKKKKISKDEKVALGKPKKKTTKKSKK